MFALRMRHVVRTHLFKIHVGHSEESIRWGLPSRHLSHRSNPCYHVDLVGGMRPRDKENPGEDTHRSPDIFARCFEMGKEVDARKRCKNEDDINDEHL